MGIPWEWELVTKLGMGMGTNGNRLHGNGRECECKKPFPGISIRDEEIAGSTLAVSLSGNDCEQVVDTQVLLSSRGIILYRPKSDDALRLEW